MTHLNNATLHVKGYGRKLSDREPTPSASLARAARKRRKAIAKKKAKSAKLEQIKTYGVTSKDRKQLRKASGKPPIKGSNGRRFQGRIHKGDRHILSCQAATLERMGKKEQAAAIRDILKKGHYPRSAA